MYNDMPMTIHSKSKQETKFQYGGHPFAETECSFIPAMDWNISSKLELDLQLLMQMPSLNLKPDVDIRLYGRLLKNSIWRLDSSTDSPFSTKFGRQM